MCVLKFSYLQSPEALTRRLTNDNNGKLFDFAEPILDTLKIGRRLWAANDRSGGIFAGSNVAVDNRLHVRALSAVTILVRFVNRRHVIARWVGFVVVTCCSLKECLFALCMRITKVLTCIGTSSFTVAGLPLTKYSSGGSKCPLSSPVGCTSGVGPISDRITGNRARPLKMPSRTSAHNT